MLLTLAISFRRWDCGTALGGVAAWSLELGAWSWEDLTHGAIIQFNRESWCVFHREFDDVGLG